MKESQKLTFAFKSVSAFDTYYCLPCALHATRAGEQIVNVILEKESYAIQCSNCGRVISDQR